MQMSGDFSLLKYFKSFSEIKNKSATDSNLQQWGPFVDFEFVIYTNEKLESNSPLQGGNSDPLSILSTGTNCGMYTSFDKTHDGDIYEFSENVSKYYKLIGKLVSQLKSRTSVNDEIKETIKKLQECLKGQNTTILDELKDMQKNGNTDCVPKWMEEAANCDITLFEEFLNKVKIFHSQLDVNSLKRLIKEELQEACKASPSVANFIYTKIEEGIYKWWRKEGNVVWLNENSGLWQKVQGFINNEIKQMSESEIQQISQCDISVNQDHIQELSDALKQKTILNIVSNSNVRIKEKSKTYKALEILGYRNLLFIGIQSLFSLGKIYETFWPCKWCDVMVVDCGSDYVMAKSFLESFQKSKEFVDILQKYQCKIIFFSTKIETSDLRKYVRSIYKCFEVNIDNME